MPRDALVWHRPGAGPVLAAKETEHPVGLLLDQARVGVGAVVPEDSADAWRTGVGATSDNSTLPLRLAFSSIDNLSAWMSPFTSADSRNSSRPAARILP